MIRYVRPAAGACCTLLLAAALLIPPSPGRAGPVLEPEELAPLQAPPSFTSPPLTAPLQAAPQQPVPRPTAAKQPAPIQPIPRPTAAQQPAPTQPIPRPAAAQQPAPTQPIPRPAAAQQSAPTQPLLPQLAPTQPRIWNAAPADPPFSEADAKLYRKVFASLGKRRRLGRVLKQAEKGRHPLPKKVLRWYYLYNAGSGARFDEITDFMAQNPGWPNQKRLRSHAEQVISKSVPTGRVLAYFRKYPPLTTAGRERYAKALRHTGDAAGADEQIRQAWIEARFRGRRGHAAQKRFYRRYGKIIRAQDQFARAERQLWKQRNNNAYRYLNKMTRGDRAVITAWGRLIRRSTSHKKIKAAMAALPADRRSHPGVLFGEMRRHTKKKNNTAAREILHQAPLDLGNADAWWIQRNIQARRALEEHNYEEAYRLANNHGLAGGKYYAEAEFVAGWVALRFLNKPDLAIMHFTRLTDAQLDPLTGVRGAYWSGRTAEVMGLPKKAKAWYVKASRHVATYYGQHAAMRLGPGFRAGIPPVPSPAIRNEFERGELVRIIRILDRVGATKLKQPFLRQVLRSAVSPGERLLATELALEIGDRRSAVSNARKAHQIGDPIVPAGYPLVTIPPVRSGKVDPPEDALLLAVIRQESQFHERAKSHAGARGLMQLMPRTARLTARKLRVRYVKAKLTRDPAYNIRLGRAYLSGLLGNFSGHYALALAGYNAGPHRVAKWIKLFGDPRSEGVDALDWVESIPFRETRNYVQRVLENLQVYRWRLGKGNLAPAHSDEIYTAMGAQATALASEPFVLPAGGFPDAADDPDEEGDDAKAQPDDAETQSQDCYFDLPMSNPDSC